MLRVCSGLHHVNKAEIELLQDFSIFRIEPMHCIGYVTLVKPT
jgi:hypothetical protein